MKTSELLKILKQNNCYLLRHGKCHDVWFSEATGRQFPVPRHKGEVKTGTLRSIFEDAGIS